MNFLAMTQEKVFTARRMLRKTDMDTMYSYGTRVARIDTKGKFYRLWDGYSATTMRHVNSFLRHYNFYGVGGKKWWDEQKVVRY